MFKSFKARLVIGYTLILVLVLALFSAIIYTYAKQQTYSRIDKSISHRLEQFENSNGVHLKGFRGMGKGIGGKQVFLEEIIDFQGKVISTNDLFGEIKIIIDETTLSQAENEPVITNTTLTDGSTVRAGIKKIDDGYFISALPLYESEQNIFSLSASLLVGNIIFVIISLITGTVFVNRALKPIKTITEKAAQISSGNLSQRVNLKGPKDELKKLADTFDEMIEKLDDLFKGQKNFFADISHELKTPLTVARGEIDVALRNQKTTKKDLKNALNNAQEELEKMTIMVNDLLSLARGEDYKKELKIEKISAKKFLQEIIDKSTNLVKSKGAKIFMDDFE
ncbi:MAG TPA: HAMP domain-containing protein, partial [Actinobacteria bacterium]|nr:HAMP domain-containing protein [Actinomycetota bacterium]